MQIIGKTVVYSGNLRVNYTPLGYVPVNGTLNGHLAGIDAALSAVLDPMPPLVIPQGTSYKVRENKQILYAIPIQVDGDLIVDGVLYQVD